ncbi:MAG TPA: hypothetical protein VKA70_15800 [Blastocatellia bacterium]|nr:hypothetical protein [Blastocatellia bacterium]
MNSVRNKYRRRSLFGSFALSLLVIAGLVLGSAPAQADAVESTLTIPVSGNFTSSNGTRFTVSGNVVVKCSAVVGEAGVEPFVIITFDATGLTVSSGSGANLKTYDTRGFQVIKTRPLVATDVITVAVPSIETGGALTAADRYNATFTLNFNAAGQITSGTVTAAAATATQ